MPEPLTLEELQKHLAVCRRTQRECIASALTDPTFNWAEPIRFWTELVADYERRAAECQSTGK